METRLESRKQVNITMRTIVISGTLPRWEWNQQTHAARHPTYLSPMREHLHENTSKSRADPRHGCLASCKRFRFDSGADL
jgi:hypothetical protein